MSLQPRPYQARAVAAVANQLAALPSTLLIMPTASGKSPTMAWIAERVGARNTLTIQHRDELVEQNEAAWRAVLPGWRTARFDADSKAFASQCGPGATFAMDKSLAAFLASGGTLPAFDLVLYDEGHHAVSPTGRKLLAACLAANPRVKAVGLTATPERGDGARLSPVFASVADQVSISEVIAHGGIVVPRGLVADVGLDAELAAVRRTSEGRGDYDEAEVAALLGQSQVLERVLDLWGDQARGPDGHPLKTVFFASGVALARDVASRLEARGFRSGLITDKTPRAKRRERLATSDHLVNCMTLTEGFNDPKVDCVVLLRRCAFRGLVIQMIGRASRPRPGKRECLVLDFGQSLQALGGLDRVFELGVDRPAREPGPMGMKPCPSPKCRRAIPLWARECALCGYVFPVRAVDAPALLDPAAIRMRPFEIAMRESAWVWIDVSAPPARGAAFMACSDRVWAIVFAGPSGWQAFGCAPRSVEWADGRVGEDKAPRALAGAEGRAAAFCAADAFLDLHGKPKEHGRAAGGYHRVGATSKQVDLAKRLGVQLGRTASLYEAACRITARLARAQIVAALAPSEARGVAA